VPGDDVPAREEAPGQAEREKAARDKAFRDLVALSEESGLYDEPAPVHEQGKLLDWEPDAAARCPFCGAAVPCASHRPGG
jgi:hypothetical protein